MKIDWKDNVAPSPISVRDLLTAHRLLPTFMQDPLRLILFAKNCRVCVIGGDEDPQAVILESDLEPGTVLIQAIVKDKELHNNREAMLELNAALAHRWFEERNLSRVECRIPIDRNATVRFLRGIGFKLETSPSGIRNAFNINNKPCDIHILGMLKGDKPKLRICNSVSKLDIEGELSHVV